MLKIPYLTTNTMLSFCVVFELVVVLPWMSVWSHQKVFAMVVLSGGVVEMLVVLIVNAHGDMVCLL